MVLADPLVADAKGVEGGNHVREERERKTEMAQAAAYADPNLLSRDANVARAKLDVDVASRDFGHDTKTSGSDLPGSGSNSVGAEHNAKDTRAGSPTTGAGGHEEPHSTQGQCSC